MTSFEYALGLFSVLMALALGDIAINVHKLIRHCRTIRWDGRVVLSALLVVVVIVRMWFSLWAIRDDGLVLVFPFYLSLFIELMILFLLAAHCLPDEPPADCDLGTFYESNSRSLWSIFALFQLSFFLHWLYFGGSAASAAAWLWVLGALGIYVLLAVVRSNWLHHAAPLALIAYEIWRNWDRTLGERLVG
jgi:hypothetical protein